MDRHSKAAAAGGLGCSLSINPPTKGFRVTITPIELTRTVNGEPMMSATAIGLLFGIDADTVEHHMKTHIVKGALRFPPEWVKAGKRRSKEAAAATGSNDVFDILAYWAKRDLGAEIVFTDDGSAE